MLNGKIIYFYGSSIPWLCWITRGLIISVDFSHFNQPGPPGPSTRQGKDATPTSAVDPSLGSGETTARWPTRVKVKLPKHVRHYKPYWGVGRHCKSWQNQLLHVLFLLVMGFRKPPISGDHRSKAQRSQAPFFGTKRTWKSTLFKER